MDNVEHLLKLDNEPPVIFLELIFIVSLQDIDRVSCDSGHNLVFMGETLSCMNDFAVVLNLDGNSSVLGSN